MEPDDIVFCEVEAPAHIEWHQGGRLPPNGRVVQIGDALGTPWWVHCPEPETEPDGKLARLAYHRELVEQIIRQFLDRYGEPDGIYFAALWHDAQPVLARRFGASDPDTNPTLVLECPAPPIDF